MPCIYCNKDEFVDADPYFDNVKDGLTYDRMYCSDCDRTFDEVWDLQENEDGDGYEVEDFLYILNDKGIRL